MSGLLIRRRDVEPAADHGFFGPDSVTWRVWSYPTALTVGFQRAVVVEELDPALVASVDETQAIFRRPRTRYDRTLRYFALVAFGGAHATAQAADVLVKVHSKGIGIEPLSGERYDANDPESQLWIHLTAWHSILYAYEQFGPGRLSADEEARYWHECALAAELQTCSPDDVPRSREGVRDYFERMRPQLVGSDVARRTMAHLLRAEVMLPPMPWPLRPGAWVVTRFLRAGTISTMPQWMRELGGLRQSRVIDTLVRPVLWMAFHLIHLSPHLELLALRVLSPSTVDVAAPVLLGVPARDPVTTTPAEAQRRFGFDPPTVAHQDLRDKQARRVFGDGTAPSEEGIAESEAILGRTH